MDISQITDELLDRALSQPQLRDMLEKLHGANGATTAFEALARDEQKQLLAELSMRLQDAPAQPAPHEVPDQAVHQIFAAPETDAIIRRVMSENSLEGEPADLPFETKRAIVDTLFRAGVLRVGPQPEQAAAVNA